MNAPNRSSMRRLFPVFLFIVGCTWGLQAQKASVRGNVYDKETAQPIAFASLKVIEASTGASTDADGFFNIPNLSPGTYQIAVSYLGYDEVTLSVSLKAGEVQYQTIYLSESGESLEEIVISGRKDKAQSNVQVSKLTVTPKQIKSLPSAGGQADLAQYLTVLPGVILTGDQGGQLYIRGGSPVQNRILLDGMTIYNPFHSIGFFSVFETELIRNVDVYTGGFNSEYGGRTSAIVDVQTREGNRKRLGGLVSASPFQVKGLLEGPIVPLKEGSDNSISFVLTGKKALINQMDDILYKYVENGIPFDYQDVYGKVTLQAGKGSKLNLFGFNYSDGVNFSNDLRSLEYGWGSTGGGMDFQLLPANSNTIVNGVFTFSDYKSQILEADDVPRKSGINGYFAGLNFTSFGNNSEFRYGLELTGFTTDFEFTNFRGYKFVQTENTSEIGAFLRYKIKKGPLVVEPGFRLQYYLSLNDVYYEPRLGLKFNVTDNFRLKAAGGLYSQNLLSTINDRDVVNIFVGFLSAPGDPIYEPGWTLDNPTPRTGNRLQTAVHYVGGFEADLLKTLEINVEGYLKDFTQLISINRNKLLAAEPNYIAETGKAYGVDLSLKYELKKANFWAAYSLGWVTRNDGFQEYPPVFDRRHNLNLVGSYELDAKRLWEFGARFNFGTGFPFTLTQGFYNNFGFPGGIGSDPFSGNGDLGVLYSDARNSGRLPAYSRVDLSLRRRIPFSKRSFMDVTAAVTNALDRQNIFYFDRIRYERVNQLPILPSLSATVQF
jgi:hypothetical protein